MPDSQSRAQASALQQEVADALTVLRGVAKTMARRWSELTDAERGNLAAMLERKTELLQQKLMPALRELEEDSRGRRP